MTSTEHELEAAHDPRRAPARRGHLPGPPRRHQDRHPPLLALEHQARRSGASAKIRTAGGHQRRRARLEADLVRPELGHVRASFGLPRDVTA